MRNDEIDYMVREKLAPDRFEYPFDQVTKNRLLNEYHMALQSYVLVPTGFMDKHLPVNKQAQLQGQSPNGDLIYTYNHDGMAYILSYRMEN